MTTSVSGRIRLLLIAVGCLFLSPAPELSAQMPPGVERDPAGARISYDDLDRFAAVYRQLTTAADTAALLHSGYLAGATVGLATYSRMYGVTPEALALALRRAAPAYHRAALEAQVVARAMETDVRASFHRLAERYPAALFPPVFFLVGRNSAGGAVKREGIFIAVESYSSPTGGREIEHLVHLVAHELTHFQQAAYDLERYTSSTSLLARAIKEGTADFVAELLTGRHINPEAHAYGKVNEWSLWSRFRCQMNEADTGDWFFTRPADPEWPQDLGYFLGYQIAAARYAREADPARALVTLLNVDDYAAFLLESGYEGDLERRQGRRLPPCRESASSSARQDTDLPQWSTGDRGRRIRITLERDAL